MNTKQVKFLDKHVGGVLINMFSVADRIRGGKEKKIKNILVIMFWGIGSIINAMPILPALRGKYPDASITVLAPSKSKDLFYKCNQIDHSIFVDLSVRNLIKTIRQIRNKFDVVVDTEHWLNISALFAFFAAPRRIGFANRDRARLYTHTIDFNPEEHAVINNLKLVGKLGAAGSDELVKINTSTEDLSFVGDFVKKSKLGKLIVGISPGSGETYTHRRWPKEKYVQLADALAEKYNASIVFVGAGDEKKLVESIQGKMKHSSHSTVGFSLGKSIALIDKCGLFIGNDSGPVHMAAAQAVKTIGLYGPETPVIFGPYGKNTIAIYKGIHCSPCIKVYKGQYIDCVYGQDNRCLRLVSVEEVLYYVERILKENLSERLITVEKTI